MGVYGRDLGHISDDVTKVIDKFGVKLSEGTWQPSLIPGPAAARMPLGGSKIVLSGGVYEDAGYVPQPLASG